MPAATLAGRVRDGAGLLLALPLWVWWALRDGGLPATEWLPGLLYLAAAIAVAATFTPIRRPRGGTLLALASLTAFAVWSAVSVSWAQDQGSAWLEAERAALVAGAFALPILWPPTRKLLDVAVLAWCVCCLGALAAGLSQARTGGAALSDGRLTAPTGYPNATAALMLMGAVSALAVAARPTSGRIVRACALGAGGALAAGTLLTQSRGIVAVAVVAVVALAALAPRRARFALAAGAAGAGIVVAHGPLLGVRRDLLRGAPAVGVDRAAVAIAILGLALAVIGFGWAALDRARGPRPARPAWSTRVRLAVAVVVACAAVAGGVVATSGRPYAYASARVHDFRTPRYASLEQQSTRFGDGLGSNRYDYWRVAVATGDRRPLTGDGAGSFAETYFRQRRSREAPVYAHSIWFGSLAELGVPGLVLMLIFAVCALWAAGRAARRGPEPARWAALAGLAPLVVLLIDASGDWTFAYPVLAVPAVALAAGASAPLVSARRARARPAARAGIAALAVVVAVTALPILASERLTDRALASFRTDPQVAFTDLRDAGRVAPISAGPATASGVIALELGRERTASAAFAQAASRDHGAWFPRMELGLLAGMSKPRRASALLTEAAVRNPSDPDVRDAREQLTHGQLPTPLSAARSALGRQG